jgi:hypothetical protein
MVLGDLVVERPRLRPRPRPRGPSQRHAVSSLGGNYAGIILDRPRLAEAGESGPKTCRARAQISRLIIILAASLAKEQ